MSRKHKHPSSENAAEDGEGDEWDTCYDKSVLQQDSDDADDADSTQDEAEDAKDLDYEEASTEEEDAKDLDYEEAPTEDDGQDTDYDKSSGGSSEEEDFDPDMVPEGDSASEDFDDLQEDTEDGSCSDSGKTKRSVRNSRMCIHLPGLGTFAWSSGLGPFALSPEAVAKRLTDDTSDAGQLLGNLEDGNLEDRNLEDRNLEDCESTPTLRESQLVMWQVDKWCRVKPKVTEVPELVERDYTMLWAMAIDGSELFFREYSNELMNYHEDQTEEQALARLLKGMSKPVLYEGVSPSESRMKVLRAVLEKMIVLGDMLEFEYPILEILRQDVFGALAFVYILRLPDLRIENGEVVRQPAWTAPPMATVAMWCQFLQFVRKYDLNHGIPIEERQKNIRERNERIDEAHSLNRPAWPVDIDKAARSGTDQSGTDSMPRSLNGLRNAIVHLLKYSGPKAFERELLAPPWVWRFLLANYAGLVWKLVAKYGTRQSLETLSVNSVRCAVVRAHLIALDSDNTRSVAKEGKALSVLIHRTADLKEGMKTALKGGQNLVGVNLFQRGGRRGGLVVEAEVVCETMPRDTVKALRRSVVTVVSELLTDSPISDVRINLQPAQTSKKKRQPKENDDREASMTEHYRFLTGRLQISTFKVRLFTPGNIFNIELGEASETEINLRTIWMAAQKDYESLEGGANALRILEPIVREASGLAVADERYVFFWPRQHDIIIPETEFCHRPKFDLWTYTEDQKLCHYRGEEVLLPGRGTRIPVQPVEVRTTDSSRLSIKVKDSLKKTPALRLLADDLLALQRESSKDARHMDNPAMEDAMDLLRRMSKATKRKLQKAIPAIVQRCRDSDIKIKKRKLRRFVETNMVTVNKRHQDFIHAVDAKAKVPELRRKAKKLLKPALDVMKLHEIYRADTWFWMHRVPLKHGRGECAKNKQIQNCKQCGLLRPFLKVPVLGVPGRKRRRSSQIESEHDGAGEQGRSSDGQDEQGRSSDGAREQDPSSDGAGEQARSSDGAREKDPSSDGAGEQARSSDGAHEQDSESESGGNTDDMDED